MSGDEIIAAIVSLLFALGTWGQWMRTGIAIPTFSPRPHPQRIVAVATLCAGAGLWWVLQRWASWDVRDSVLYTLFYFLMGIGFTGFTLVLLDRMGLSLRDDVVERRNHSAALALGGAVPGLTAAFAGANIGDGPGWWVVVFCATLSTGGVLAGWIVLDRITGAGEAITIERDPGTGLRVGAWFLACGLILGRSVAGDWTGAGNAVNDFARFGSLALALLIFALFIELTFRRRGGDRVRITDYFAAIFYSCIATAYLLLRHPW